VSAADARLLEGIILWTFKRPEWHPAYSARFPRKLVDIQTRLLCPPDPLL
jgi:hypothetical protein